MRRKEAERAFVDLDMYSMKVFGQHTDWRIEKRGRQWVLVAPVNSTIDDDQTMKDVPNENN